ncbi:TolC family protein [Phenylobacterium montanum]|uniref:TolC family protein n=1 Tax=Phenylobacterium montanum TaxID=2823693 RepID=A0A975IX19_9CAUL|nr:TolC family protein [Caulobacter sp. S6]QUD90435.1 TolC family protein [Caulobacter sp. S6]
MNPPGRGWAAPLSAALLSALAAAGAARAETLADAIALAYQTNPALLAGRADLRALDERFVQARAQLGPTVQLSASGDRNASKVRESSLFSNGLVKSRYYGIDSESLRIVLSQPLYTGGQAGMEIRASEADVLAGRQVLRQQEATILGQVITAYADVLLNRDLVTIAQQNIDILRDQDKEIEAKFAVREVTATDRALTQARLIAAQVDLSRARANLQDAEAAYVAAVGQQPGQLEPLPDLPGLPQTVDAAFDAADTLNPQVQAAQFTEMASRLRVAEAKAADGVQVSIGGSYSREPLAPYLRDQRIISYDATFQVSKNLYTAGTHDSRVRQALEDNNRDNLKIADARRQVVMNLAKAWNDLALRRSILIKLHDQLDQEAKSYQGSKLEARIGIRTTFDTLNAEQEYQATKVSLFQTFHDEYLTRVAVLAAMGLLQGEDIDPSIKPYRPEASFKKVSARAALPWEGLVQALDGAAGPWPKREPASRDVLGVNRPSATDGLPAPPRWSDLAAYLAPPAFK